MSNRVFVVDDEPVIATTLTAILRMQGYDVERFTDPLKALAAFNTECPNLLISDVMMPGLSGVELAIHTKALCPNCKVLLVSGNAATSDLLRSAVARGHHFKLLTKPVHPTLILEAIKDNLEAAV